MTLDFTVLRETNVRRCNAAFGPHDDWSPTDWACATLCERAAEAGRQAQEKQS